MILHTTLVTRKLHDENKQCEE